MDINNTRERVKGVRTFFPKNTKPIGSKLCLEELLMKSAVTRRGYVRKYYDVQNHAYLCFFMRDFEQFYAQFLSVNQIHNLRYENGAFPIKIMCVFLV